jgi:hypothetical protein
VNVGFVLPTHGGTVLVLKYEARSVPLASVALMKVKEPE